MELPGASEDTTKQDEAGALMAEEKMAGEEAKRLVWNAMEKPAMEEVLKVDGEGLILQDPEDPVEKGKGKEEKDHVTFQDEEALTRGGDRVREAQPEGAWDTLTLQDDGLDLKGGKEQGRSHLAWQDQEDTPTGEKTTEGDKDRRISMDDILKMMKEEGQEEEEEEEGQEKEEDEEGQEQEEEATKQSLRAPHVQPVGMWSQYRERIKFAVNKRKLSLPHLGYFTKVFSQAPSSSEIKKKSRDELRKWDREPMLSRLFTLIPSDRHPKKFELRWPSVLGHRKSDLSRVSKIMSSNLEEDHDKKPSEEAMDIELEDVCSRSPESLLSKSQEAEAEMFAEAKTEEAEPAPSDPKKLQCGSFYSYQDNGTIGAGITSSVWSMGQQISHNRAFRAKQNAQEKIYKQKLLKHERDTKTAVPLPLQEKIEEEVLAILLDTFKDYQKKIGMSHPLTIQMQEQVDKLYLQLHARGVI